MAKMGFGLVISVPQPPGQLGLITGTAPWPVIFSRPLLLPLENEDHLDQVAANARKFILNRTVGSRERKGSHFNPMCRFRTQKFHLNLMFSSRLLNVIYFYTIYSYIYL